MTAFVFDNTINTTLASAITSAATTLTLSSSTGLPTSIASGYVLALVLNDQATRENYEVVYATAISGTTLTVTRAQEGTTALAWNAGDYAYSAPTSGQMGNFGQLGRANTWTATNTFSLPVGVAAGTTSGQAVNLGQFVNNIGTTGFVLPGSSLIIKQGLTGVVFGSAIQTPYGLNPIFDGAFPNSCIGVWIIDRGNLGVVWSVTSLSASAFGCNAMITGPAAGSNLEGQYLAIGF